MNPNPFISLGAGIQSTTLLLMAAHGEITPKPKYAIFSDTGWEPDAVYKHLEWLEKEVSKYGIEVIVTSKSNLRDDLIKSISSPSRFATIPFYILNEDGTTGMVRRQCTREYKVEPVTKKMRELLGYKPRQRIKSDVELWIGISTDEIERVKPNRERWIQNRYPLIEKGMNRLDCINWLEKKGYPIPPKSSCIGCPFRDDFSWLNMKRNDPAAWEEAVYIDKKIKELPRFEGIAFLHRSCLPLDEVDLQENQATIFDYFLNECEGMCGV